MKNQYTKKAVVTTASTVNNIIKTEQGPKIKSKFTVTVSLQNITSRRCCIVPTVVATETAWDL